MGLRCLRTSSMFVQKYRTLPSQPLSLCGLQQSSSKTLHRVSRTWTFASCIQQQLSQAGNDHHALHDTEHEHGNSQDLMMELQSSESSQQRRRQASYWDMLIEKLEAVPSRKRAANCQASRQQKTPHICITRVAAFPKALWSWKFLLQTKIQTEHLQLVQAALQQRHEV